MIKYENNAKHYSWNKNSLRNLTSNNHSVHNVKPFKNKHIFRSIKCRYDDSEIDTNAFGLSHIFVSGSVKKGKNNDNYVWGAKYVSTIIRLFQCNRNQPEVSSEFVLLVLSLVLWNASRRISGKKTARTNCSSFEDCSRQSTLFSMHFVNLNCLPRTKNFSVGINAWKKNHDHQSPTLGYLHGHLLQCRA